MSQVRVATPADLPQLATTLAQAFADDPVWAWMIPRSPGRARLRTLFGALLRHALPHGHVYTVDGGRAVALWSPPGRWKLPTPAMLRAALPIARSAGTRLPRLLGRLDAIEKEHARQPQDHWYLEYIGAADDARGTGLGSLLLADALRRMDTARAPVYLESSNERNLSFYRRHGFTVTGRLAVRGGPPQWLLWRDPQPVA